MPTAKSLVREPARVLADDEPPVQNELCKRQAVYSIVSH